MALHLETDLNKIGKNGEFFKLIGGNHMKKRSFMIPALLACIIFTGCGKKAAETEAPTEAPTEAVTTEAVTETEKVTEPQTETETEKEDSMNRTRSLKGLVVASDASQLTIQTERGKQLQFSLTGADIQVTGGIAAGNNVTVLYKGSVEDTDTSNAKVLMVKDLAQGETPVTEGEPMTEAEEANPEAGAGTLEGTISDINAERIVILSNDGDSYYFSIADADMNLKNGTQVGNYVTVSYNGDIYGPDLVTATAITDAQDEADKVPYGGSDGEDYSYIGGSMVDCSPTTLTIMTENEEEITLDTSSARLVYRSGLNYGTYVIAEYQGDDPSTAKMTAVYDYTGESDSDGSSDGSEDQQTVSDEGTDNGDQGYVDEGEDSAVQVEGQEA